jgi:hypothetical protein
MPADKDHDLIILMNRAATGNKFLVTVLDGSKKGDNRIEGATIEVAGKTAKTGKDGQTKIDPLPPPGKHPYTVSADKFKPGKGVVEVVAGKDTDLTEILEKEGGGDFKPPTESKEPTLRRGAKSEDKWVEYLQQLLGIEIDGKFGPATETAVRKFQTEKKLQVDGIVGNQTWAALRGNAPEKPSTDGRKPNTFVEKGAEARWYTEGRNIASYDKANDELRLVAVSVGTEKIDEYKADIRVIPALGSSRMLGIKIGPSYKELPGKVGFLHAVRIPQFRRTFGPGVHELQAFLPQDLGGDKWKGKIEV